MITASNSIIWRTIILLIAVCLLSISAQAQYGSGTGEPNDPYLIYTAEQMNQIGLHEEDWDKHFKLMADIDLSAYKGASFNLIGSYDSDWNEKSFTGVFEGNGYVISGFSCDGDALSNRFFVGLFRSVDGVNAKIQNLRLIDPNIIDGGIYIGALIGRLHNGTISNCVIETGRVVAPEGDEIGGIVGMNIQGVLSNCRAEGCVVQGRLRVGGLTGTNEGTIQNCYGSGEISGKRMIGGQVGGNFGSIINTYSTSIVTGLGSMQLATGGLVGLNRGTIQASWATGDVTGIDDVGGLVGQNGDNSNITDSYATGHVSGRKHIGGLVGTCIQNNSIDKCYATGSVSAEENGGGLVGSSYNTSVISASFWDVETSGQTNSAGGQGKTTNEMQMAITFLDADWDFVDETSNGTEDIWWIDDGNDYPRLSWEPRKYCGGTGEPNDPYLIHTTQHLNTIGAEPNDWDKNFKLMVDIDLSGYSYESALIAPDVDPCEPGFQGTSFTGVLDGNGHKISNLTITSGDYVGLFGQTELGAEIKDLGITDVNITGADYVGGFVGFSKGNISTSYCTGTISGDQRVGGLTGRNWSNNITACYSTATITSNSDAGGITANNYGSITNCYNDGAVSSYRDAGGLVGENYGTIDKCYSTGAVSGDFRPGGLVSYNWPDGGIVSGFWDTETSGQSTSDGGTGKTTTEMQTVSTFLEAGWDFVDETNNGTEDIWRILEGQDYPRLWWENDNN